MNTIFYVSLKNEPVYDKYNCVSKFIDKIKTKKNKNVYIKELNSIIKRVEIPANINRDAYKFNLSRILNKYYSKYDHLSLNGDRLYDLKFMSKFQKSIISYSIVQSIRIILMQMKKSIKYSNILIDVDETYLIESLLEELAQESRNIIIISNNFIKTDKIRESIMSKYGLAVEIIRKETDVENIDFVITSKNYEYICKNVWYINNLFVCEEQGTHINGVLYKVPWDTSIQEMPPQLIGSLIKKQKNKSISEILTSNGIELESILFNDNEVNLMKKCIY